MASHQYSYICSSCKKTILIGNRPQGKTGKCPPCASRDSGHKNAKHMLSKGRIYYVWRNMLSRCENPKHKSFDRYGGRGIRVCQEWHDSSAFFRWALANGYSDDLQIDRRNNEGHYEQNNCRFVSGAENSRNSSSAKLNHDSVSAIKIALQRGEKGRALAFRFGVSEALVSMIKSGKIWADI